jgi:hypothetical protein
MGHKYHPDVLKELLGSLRDIAERGQPASPDELFLQTRHPRVHQSRWISVERMQDQYADTQVTAKRSEDTWQIEASNVAALRLAPTSGTKVVIGSSAFDIRPGQSLLLAPGSKGSWHELKELNKHQKRPGLSGPIDDAFFDPFLIVLPSGNSSNQKLAQWVECESVYQISRWKSLMRGWKSLMRGSPRVKRDTEVTAEDVQRYHLVLWGDPESNSMIAKVLEHPTVPFTWSKKQIELRGKQWSAEETVPCLIMPNSLNPDRYVVLNSGLTFRDAHDRTNSLQNPQLPDWALLSLDGKRTSSAALPVLSAGFFDNDWR